MFRSRSGERSRRPSLWKVPLLLLVAVLGVTFVFARQQSQTNDERRLIEFETITGEIEYDLASAIDDRINEFSIAHDYIASSVWLDPDEFQDFLARRRTGRSSVIVDDPGLTVAEYVADVDALEAREHGLGRADFTVWSMLPIAADEHIVITNVERDLDVVGRSLIGMDATAFRSLLEPPGLFDQSEILVELAPMNELLGGFTLSGQIAPDPEDYEEAVLYLIAPWENADRSARGVVIRLDSVNAVVGDIANTLPDHFRLDARLVGSDHYIAQIDRRDPGDRSVQFEKRMVFDDAQGALNGDLDGLDISVIASNDFRLPDETSTTLTWVLGALGALLAACFAALRSVQARRLADTGVELELAQAMASTDPLTGLLNRQGLVESMGHPAYGAGTLVFVDIDNFKVVNDQHGHAEGDRVLRRIGHELRQLVRTSDSVCRLGGDEFLLYLPGTAVRGRVDHLATMIRNAVEDVDIRISASIGWAHRDAGDARTIDELMRVADGAMYDEKRAKQQSLRS